MPVRLKMGKKYKNHVILTIFVRNNVLTRYMGIRGIDIVGRATGAVVGLACLVCMFSRCANTAAPTGGPKDTLPPMVLRMSPADMTTGFKGRRIFVEFDEYVQLRDLSQEFYVSPAMKRMPTVTVRGRGIQIDLNVNDTLKENTTYAFNFGNSVRDNNEGNPLSGFRYVMSTGTEIDSMVMSGYTVDAYTNDSVPKTLLFFYDAVRDSIPEYDSLIFKGEPDVIGRAENNGVFFTQNLKPIDYKVYAVRDKNNNKTYEPGSDMIGFLDSLVNPAEMPSFSICYDTLRKYLVAQPQTYFRMFTDDAFRRQTLSRVDRPLQHQMLMVFSAPYPDIRSLTFEGIDSAQVLREYLKPERDSISLWFNVPAEQLPDTIKGELKFMRHDSVNNWELATVPIKGTWRMVESNEQRRERERVEREKKKLIEQGLTPPKEPNPFKYNVEATNPLNPEKNIVLTFAYPLSGIDTSRISLVRYGEAEAMYRVSFKLVQDTMNIRRWTISAQWQSGQKYELQIPDGVFTNIAGEKNDTLKSQFEVMSPDKYGTISVQVKGKTETSKYVLQLTSGTGKEVTQEFTDVVTGTYKFMYVKPGTVRLRVIEDVNGNGKWDHGDLVHRRQSERVELYVDPSTNESEIITRANWENEIVLDMNEMFAPITMESVLRDIERQDAIRLRKYFERLQERQKQQKQQQNTQQQGTTFNPTEGFGI